MNFRRISSLTVMLIAFLAIGITSCKHELEPDKSRDTVSKVISKAYEINGEKYVDVELSSIHNYAKSRTLIPDNPKLYFSVVGSTHQVTSSSSFRAWTTEKYPNIKTTSAGDADCSSAVALAEGKLVLSPFYAADNSTTCIVPPDGPPSSGSAFDTDTNVMTGLTLTLKVGPSYYLTVYGTRYSPKGWSSYRFSRDITNETIYTDYDSFCTNINMQATDPDNEIYAAYREGLVAALAEDAVVKGTIHIKVDVDSSGNVVFKDADNNGTLSSIIIPASSNSIDGTGYASIPLSLEKTSADSGSALEAKNKGLSVSKVRIKWTKRGSHGTNGYADVAVDNTQDKNVLIQPFMGVGEYDLDLLFYDGTESNIVFQIHDTVVIWKNQESKVLGNSSFYGDVTYGTSGLKSSPTAIGDGVTLETNTVTGGTQKGYVITAQNIIDYFQTTYYVTGSGNSLSIYTPGAGDPARDGSLFRPFDNVNAAVQAIKAKRDAGYGDDTTDWNIVVDGTETTTTAISFTNTTVKASPTATTAAVYKSMNLTIRPFSTTNVGLSNSVTFKNAVSDNSTNPFNLYLINTNWDSSVQETYTGNSPDGTGQTFTAGCNVFLKNSTLSSNATTPAAGKGIVYLSKAEANTSAEGTLYIDASSDGITSGSTVYNIWPLGFYNHNVLSYKYHNVNEAVSSTPVNFIRKDPSNRFALNSHYILSDNDTNIRRTLSVDQVAGSATYGCMTVQAQDVSVTAQFTSGSYRGTVAVSPLTLDKDTVLNETANSQTVTITVTSESPSSAPANSETVLGYLKSGGNLNFVLQLPGGATASSVAGENPALSNYITITYPTAAEAASDAASAAYKATLTWNKDYFGYAAQTGQYILYVKFDLSDGTEAIYSEGFYVTLTD